MNATLTRDPKFTRSILEMFHPLRTDHGQVIGQIGTSDIGKSIEDYDSHNSNPTSLQQFVVHQCLRAQPIANLIWSHIR